MTCNITSNSLPSLDQFIYNLAVVRQLIGATVIKVVILSIINSLQMPKTKQLYLRVMQWASYKHQVTLQCKRQPFIVECEIVKCCNRAFIGPRNTLSLSHERLSPSLYILIYNMYFKYCIYGNKEVWSTRLIFQRCLVDQMYSTRD